MMFPVFKRKRKQCVKCRKTFYKAVIIENDWAEAALFKVSPCCQADYIIV